MKTKNLIPIALALTLGACGGGSGAGGALPAAASASSAADASWSGTFRYTPISLTLSLAAAGMQYFYIDDAPVNGIVPATQTFLNDFTQANPSVVAGACSAQTILSVATISPNVYSGQQNPTIVISAYPLAAGTCSQTVQLGANGTQRFTITVTP